MQQSKENNLTRKFNRKKEITKIWNIAKSKDGNLSNSLHRSLLYIVNPVKTDGGVLVGGVNVMPDAELAYEQMCETKQIFGKELGRQGYHVVLSCSVGEGDPQTMYQLTQEFIEEYLGDRYEALFAVHVDKGHLHSHIVFNSVSMIDGYKYQYTKGDWKNIIQPITNHLCEKYGWSVIPAEYVKDAERMSRGEYEYQKSLQEETIRVNNVQNLESNNLTEPKEEPLAEPQVESQQVAQTESHSEIQETSQLPVYFPDFKSLPVSTQSHLLCTELGDTMQVFNLLQQYAKDTGYQGSFDELYEMASAISEENIKSYEEIKAQMIADELIRAGATAQNFYQIKTDSLVEAFLSAGEIDFSLISLIIKVERKLGIEPDYRKNFALVNAIYAEINTYEEKADKQR